MLRAFQHKRSIIGLALSVVATVLSLGLIFAQPQGAAAQNITPDMLRALQQRNNNDNGNDDGPGPKPTIQSYQPVADLGVAPKSPLEKLYSERAGRDLVQMGYSFFGVPATVTIAQAGAVRDSYVLGVGDELVVELRGQENSTFRQRIDRNGRLVLPRLNPIGAGGVTFGQFRAMLDAEVNRAYVSTKAYVSLGEAHQVSVLVTGYVRSPGMRTLSAFASPIDALLISGGITKAGSLRNVQIIRAGVVRTIDLYGLILKGGSIELGTLQEGDRLYVGPLGATVAISGSTKRPGIFELPVGATSTTAASLISLAGGLTIAGAYDLSKSELNRDGSTRLVPITMGSVVRSGEIVFVEPNRKEDFDRVTIVGAVLLPGTRPLSTTRSTTALFHSSSELASTAYTPFALIARRNPTSNAISLVPFSVLRALQNADDKPFQSDDRVYVFSLDELRALTRVVTKDLNTPYSAREDANLRAPAAVIPPGAAPADPTAGPAANGDVLPDQRAPDVSPAVVVPDTIGGTNGRIAGAGALIDPRFRPVHGGNSTESAALAEAQALIRAEGAGATQPPRMAVETDAQIVDRIATALGTQREMLLHAVADHVIWVLDQVNVPGVYAAAEGTSVTDMIEAAGGPQAQADLSSIEVTSTQFDRLVGLSRTTRNNYSQSDPTFRTVIVRPLDVIRLRSVYADRTGETVTVAGQVRYPGVFDITRDERLSSVLQRAGGVTEVAYPYGAIFTRRSVAIHERESNDRSARELQSQLALLAAKPSSNAGTELNSINFLTGLVEQVREAPTLGRVTVTADPVVLASHPELDVILEPGDSIFIPKRPSSVTVSGEVLNPGSFQFQSGLSVDDYIRLAGGPSQSANRSDAVVVMPDGSASPVEDNWLSYGQGGHIPPGSAIIVPRNLRPFDWGQFVKDATQVISQLAVSAAALAVLRNN